MREFEYWLLDVFTDTALAGNQLAVFLNGTGLSDREMQSIAREMNLSETTFCFPDELSEVVVGEAGVRVRVFTTDEELPFAGHPTLGTATALRLTLPALCGAPEVVLRLPVGPVPVRFTPGERPGEPALPFDRPSSVRWSSRCPVSDNGTTPIAWRRPWRCPLPLSIVRSPSKRCPPACPSR